MQKEIDEGAGLQPVTSHETRTAIHTFGICREEGGWSLWSWREWRHISLCDENAKLVVLGIPEDAVALFRPQTHEYLNFDPYLTERWLDFLKRSEIDAKDLPDWLGKENEWQPCTSSP